MKKGVQFTLTKIINRQIQNELSFTFQLLASGQFTLSLDDLGTTQPGLAQFFSLKIVWVSSLNVTILDHKLAPSPAKVRNVWAQQIWIRGRFTCFMDSGAIQEHDQIPHFQSKLPLFSTNLVQNMTKFKQHFFEFSIFFHPQN